MTNTQNTEATPATYTKDRALWHLSRGGTGIEFFPRLGGWVLIEGGRIHTPGNIWLGAAFRAKWS